MNNEKLSRILGLRLLAIREGTECGAIRELVLDVEEKAVKYLVLDTGKGCFGFRVLPNEKIAGMGKDFAITSSSEYVSDIWSTQAALDLNYTDSDLIGARVVSSTGDVVGKIVDFEFELVEGDITAYIMEDGGVLPKGSIVTLSRGIVFIDKEKAEDAIIGNANDPLSFEPGGSMGGFGLEPEIDYSEPQEEPIEQVEFAETQESYAEAAFEDFAAKEQEAPVEELEMVETITEVVQEAIPEVESAAEIESVVEAEPEFAAEVAEPVVEADPGLAAVIESEPDEEIVETVTEVAEQPVVETEPEVAVIVEPIAEVMEPVAEVEAEQVEESASIEMIEPESAPTPVAGAEATAADPIPAAKEPVSVTREPMTGRSSGATASDRLAALRNRAASAAQQAVAPAPPPQSDSPDNSDMKNYFERRRTEFLIGKVVKQRILAPDGTVLADVGQKVTAEMIEAIKAADKIIELTMGVS